MSIKLKTAAELTFFVLKVKLQGTHFSMLDFLVPDTRGGGVLRSTVGPGGGNIWNGEC